MNTIRNLLMFLAACFSAAAEVHFDVTHAVTGIVDIARTGPPVYYVMIHATSDQDPQAYRFSVTYERNGQSFTATDIRAVDERYRFTVGVVLLGDPQGLKVTGVSVVALEAVSSKQCESDGSTITNCVKEEKQSGEPIARIRGDQHNVLFCSRECGAWRLMCNKPSARPWRDSAGLIRAVIC